MKSENIKLIHLAVFASGGGSNAGVLTTFFEKHTNIRISLFVTNNPQSGVVALGKKYDIPVRVISGKTLEDPSVVHPLLKEFCIDYLILAGFLKKIPDYLIKTYPDKIINIHPSLLPKYGGKGMYGHFVHEAVKNSGDDRSGCTVHLVNEEYDKGRILHQTEIPVTAEMSAEDIAAAVLKEEHLCFAPVIEMYIRNREGL
jgi:phosphoribosylglycinamide formyltransferase 1